MSGTDNGNGGSTPIATPPVAPPKSKIHAGYAGDKWAYDPVSGNTYGTRGYSRRPRLSTMINQYRKQGFTDEQIQGYLNKHPELAAYSGSGERGLNITGEKNKNNVVHYGETPSTSNGGSNGGGANTDVRISAPPIPGGITAAGRTLPISDGYWTPDMPGGTPYPRVPGIVQNPSAPSWWTAAAYSNPTEDQTFGMIANALIPTLSPEDQRTMGNFLATNYADAYSSYGNADYGAPPATIDANMRNYYMTSTRAQAAKSALERMRAAAGSEANLGPGYTFMSNVVNLLDDFGNSGGPMTSLQYRQFTSALNSLLNTASGQLKPYASLAKMFAMPSFSAGEVAGYTSNPRMNV